VHLLSISTALIYVPPPDCKSKIYGACTLHSVNLSTVSAYLLLTFHRY